MRIDRRAFSAGLGLSLLAGPLRAQGSDVTPADFTGRVLVNTRGGIRLHTYLADPKGALVTSHIVETGNGLVLIDGQFVTPSAMELKRYIAGLGKPVQRIVLSHQHPDHWFGLHHAAPGIPVHAGPVTAKFLRDNGATLIADRKADTSVPTIAGVIAESAETIDGVEFRFRQVLDTEAPEITVVEIPAANAVIVQDLVYNKVHAVVPRQLDAWIAVLNALEKSAGSPLVMAGHGAPVGLPDIGGFVRYLETVKPLVAQNIGRESEIPAIVDTMSKAFPDYQIPQLLRLGLSRALKA
jgi:glyoxylase-like metal-dependent hydrolase (beta-lactamase superfamily II)